MTFIITCQFLFPSHLYKTGNLSLINKCYRLTGKKSICLKPSDFIMALRWILSEKYFLNLCVKNAKMFYTVFNKINTLLTESLF